MMKKNINPLFQNVIKNVIHYAVFPVIFGGTIMT